MIKRKSINIIIVAIIAASLMFAGIPRQPAVVSASPTLLSDYAGIAAYTNIGETTLDTVKDAFLMIEYVDPSLNFLIGTLDLPIYETAYDPLVLVDTSGLIVAFYPAADPAGKIVDVISKNLDETLLEKAVKIVASAAGVVPTTVSHYDFGNPTATKLLLVAEYELGGNAFTLMLDVLEPPNEYFGKSYAFYRTYYPNFTIDNDLMEQVNFIEKTAADYFGDGYYGTIYDSFPVTTASQIIDFVPRTTYSFAVDAGDDLGFGSLAILYSIGVEDAIPYTVADGDFVREIALGAPSINPSFDLTPSAPTKTSPSDAAFDIGLDPILSWTASTAPNYEYCIDTSAPDVDPLTEDCNTEWISVGSDTSVTLSNLFYETTYYWQVRAINSYSIVEGGSWFSFTTADGIAPEAFTKNVLDPLYDFSEPIGSLSKVTMSWEESYGAYYYEVCVDTTPYCVAPELWHNVGIATSATMGDLLLDTTYYWQVRAINHYPSTGDEINYTYADEGVWNSFETRRFSKLRPVENEVYNLTLPFKWEETPIGNNDYEYCIVPPIDDGDNDESNDVPDISKCGWKKVTGTSVVVKRLTAGDYFWQVRTFEDKLEANNGEWWKFRVLAKKDVSKINLFKVSPIDGAVDQLIDELELSWKTTKTAIAYEYCYFDIDDTDSTPISDDDTCTYPEDGINPWTPVGKDTSTLLSDLSTTITYLWQVRANIGTADDPYWLYADKGEFWAFTTMPE